MDPEQATLDIDSATDSIGADLFNSGEPIEKAASPGERGPLEDSPAPDDAPDGEPRLDDDAPPDGEQAPVEQAAKAPPKSWPREMHDHWSKTPPEVQAYWETREKQMLDGLSQYKEDASFGQSIQKTIQPYIPMLRASGANPAQAVEVLLNANYRLTTGPMESRVAAFKELGVSLGVMKPQAAQSALPPEVQQIVREQERLRSALMQREQQEFEAKRTEVASNVEAFAKDKPYFDEVADDIIAFIEKGADLQTAYDKAVYANPVTREKEMERARKEAQQKLVLKGKEEAAKARKATAVNVNSRDTGMAPTELLGTMEDTMKQVLAKRRAQTH